MNRETLDCLEYEIYPGLYSNIETAFPEFGFKKISGGYVSTTDMKITGERGGAGKVYIYDNNITNFIDYTRGPISIWKYLQATKGLSPQDTLYKLAELSGARLPEATGNNYEDYSNRVKRAEVWEAVNSYLVRSLEKSTEAKELRNYLSHRGYTENDIKVMELGYMPSQDKLIKYLREKGYNDNDISSIELSAHIGKTHTLTIPFRETTGNIIGITVRNINYKPGDAVGKYLNSTGLNKTDKLINLRPQKGDKSLVIVEGQLDCLLASARGIENIVGLGSKSLNKDQLKTAIRYGAKKITLCLDNEEGTVPNILKAIEIIRDNSDLKIYVAQLPKGIKDADEFITKKGEEEFRKVIQDAMPYYEYQLTQIVKPYNAELNAEERDSAIKDIMTVASKIKEPIDRDLYIDGVLEALSQWGISKEAIEATVEKLRYKEETEKRKKKLSDLLNKVNTLRDKPEEAIELLKASTRELNNAIGFENLLSPITEGDLREKIKNKPQSLDSGYKIKEDELLIPSGAISIFSAPTSHGKTTMLINIALNTALKYSDKTFHIFSYEEEESSILLKALNCYMNIKLSNNNLKTLKSHYQGEDKYFIKDTKENFISKKDFFYRELISSKRLNIHYVDYDSDKLIEAIEFICKKQSVGAVYIDYMQLLRKGKNKYNSRQEELKQVCLDLKDLAVETGIPIVLGAQFNREVINHSKILSTNIGEAGDIERIANTIIGFWNNSFKPVEFTQADKNYFSEYQKPNTIYAKVLKMREGEAGIEFRLDFNGNTSKIENYEIKEF